MIWFKNVSSIPRMCYHIMQNSSQQCSSLSRCVSNLYSPIKHDNFLKPVPFCVIPASGIKYVGIVHKKCAKCYYVWKDSRQYVYCKESPSHNQCTKIERDKWRLIITQKTHGRIRPY